MLYVRPANFFPFYLESHEVRLRNEHWQRRRLHEPHVAQEADGQFGRAGLPDGHGQVPTEPEEGEEHRQDAAEFFPKR